MCFIVYLKEHKQLGGTMFGHQEPDQDNNQQNEPAADGLLTHGTTPTDTTMASAPAVNNNDDGDNDSAGDYIMTEPQHAPAAPGVPHSDSPTAPQAPMEPTTVPSHSASDDLIDLKQKALQQLSPLVDHLDQNPEEKFRTTMMLIQASDNQALLKTAYEAAQQIPDEKTRAQALLDVVNEINYFTQQEEA